MRPLSIPASLWTDSFNYFTYFCTEFKVCLFHPVQNYDNMKRQFAIEVQPLFMHAGLTVYRPGFY